MQKVAVMPESSTMQLTPELSGQDEKVEHGDWVVIFMLTFRFYSTNRLQNK